MLAKEPAAPRVARAKVKVICTPLFEKYFPRGLYTRLHSALAG